MNRLKQLREERNINQKELADEVGIYWGTIAKWEQGANDMRDAKYSNLKKLACYFGVSIDYLVGDSYKR